MMDAHSSARPAADGAEVLLERLRVCALSALDAARAGDVERLRRAVQERDELTARAGPLLDRIRAAAPGEPGAEEARRSILLTLQGVQAADAWLLAELESRRDQLGEELVRLQHESAPAAYQPTHRPGQHLDLRR